MHIRGCVHALRRSLKISPYIQLMLLLYLSSGIVYPFFLEFLSFDIYLIGGRPQSSRSPPPPHTHSPVILLLAVLRRLFCFAFLVILDVVCRYLSLFLLYINIKIGKIAVKEQVRNLQKLTQLSSRPHQRHLVGKKTAQKDTIIDITSNSQVNSNFPYSVRLAGDHLCGYGCSPGYRW